MQKRNWFGQRQEPKAEPPLEQSKPISNPVALTEPITETQVKQRFDSLFVASSQELLRYLTEPSDDLRAVTRAKIAASALSSYTRHEATLSSRNTTAVLVARHLSANREEFVKYLKVSVPSLMPSDVEQILARNEERKAEAPAS